MLTPICYSYRKRVLACGMSVAESSEIRYARIFVSIDDYSFLNLACYGDRRIWVGVDVSEGVTYAFKTG
jgi:hypothetical protein